MQHAEHLTPTQMQQFLEAGATLSFAGTGRKPVYALIERTLRGCQYPALSKKDKGIVRRYLAKVSGLSRAQITRLIARRCERGVLKPRAARRRRFPRRYTSDDIARLAAVDAAHEGFSGPAIRRILERECKVYGKTAYQRLAAISPSRIYNLRRTRAVGSPEGDRRSRLNGGALRPPARPFFRPPAPAAPAAPDPRSPC